MLRRTVLKYLGAAAAASTFPVGLSPAETLDCSLPADPTGGATGIFLNQVGYRSAGAKVASVTGASVGDRGFVVRSGGEGSAVAFRGTLGRRVKDEASGDEVMLADFSGLTIPGRYRLETGGHASDPFTIGGGVYGEALVRVTRAFYGQRCGCKVDLGGGYKHRRCHKHEAFHASSGKAGKVRNGGGWHDAGDYGRYVVNSGITTGTLLWAWELYPAVLGSLHLSIPESGRGMPDFLAEVKWNLDWMLSMQDADGGVWQKQTSERFCAFLMPEKDKLTSYVIGTGAEPYKSTAATADLAAVAAIAARCYAGCAPKYAAQCLEAARKAWDWAVAHPDVSFVNPPGILTGEYGDKSVSDEVAWASAELWRSTGEEGYERHFLASLPQASEGLQISTPGWNSVASLGCWSYVMAERAGSSEVKEKIRTATMEAGRGLVSRAERNGYGNTLEVRDFVWGSNSVAANQSLLLFMADRFSPSTEMVDAALGNLHYLLGRNCHGISWVTQTGVRPYMHPHHRPSGADGIERPWPGLLSGGPNAHPGDVVARKLPAAPPMKMWVDDQGAYSMNEVAINWNAPLVFLLAAANAAGLPRS